VKRNFKGKETKHHVNAEINKQNKMTIQYEYCTELLSTLHKPIMC